MHYRSEGTGRALVMLHPSPRSSRMLEPFGKLLSGEFRVILPDLPGYGFSDPLPEKVESLYDYAPYLKDFFREVTGGEKFALYGSATGAQMGIAYALRHPEDLSCLYLDNTAHFTDEQYRQIVSHYFPDFSPKDDGSHLLKIWMHLRDSCLFFPWFDYQKGKRLTGGMPPASILNEMALDYLLSGAHWDTAYRAAFAHEKVENVKALQVPVVLFKWQNSILLEYIEQLIASGLPPNVEVIETPANMQERWGKMMEIFRRGK